MLMASTNRIDAPADLVVDGKPLTITFIQNPTIEDVLVGEARVQATSLETNNPSLVSGRVVPRAIRNFLIEEGVE